MCSLQRVCSRLAISSALDGGKNVLDEFQSLFVSQMKPPVQGSQLRCLTMLHKVNCVS